MKHDFFYILLGLMLMTSTTLFAETTGTEIPLREIKSVGMFMPTDSPEQSSDDPPRPNQFHAYIAGQTLSFRIANTNLNHVIVHNPSGVVMLDASFVGDTAFVLPTLGQHIVEIQNAGLHLIGDFNREPNRTRNQNESTPLNYTISRTADCYYIEIEYPNFEIDNVVLPNDTALTAQLFNKIIYPYYASSLDPFDYGIINGQPEVPFLSLNLQIPEDAIIDTVIQYIDYYNDIYLTHPFAPVQNALEDGPAPLQYDYNYYINDFDNVWTNPVIISEPHLTKGTYGINVQFRPVLYFPDGDVLRPIYRMKLSICVSGSQTLSEMYEETIDEISLGDMVNFYDTYKYIDTIVHPEYKGNFLILATEDYEDEAEDYANHKNNLGFNAWVEILDQYMLDSAFIRQYIKLWYDYEECRPKFILLIGADIPYSAGVLGNHVSNPPTDMYYACVDEYYMEDENVSPDIYVGRWPVHNATELESVMQKSEEYDELTNPYKRMLIFSGTGSGVQNFVQAAESVYWIVHDSVPSMELYYYDGRYGFNDNTMRAQFENYENLIFVYRGHGARRTFGPPYQNITIFNLPNSLPYFNFGFGCIMNYPDSLGTVWVNIGDRSCTFYGATVSTYPTNNTTLQKNIFRGMKEDRNITIGELVYNGVRKANNIGVEKEGLTAYVLNGDPSLYIYGTRLFGDVLQHSPANGEKAEDLNNIELSEDIASYALYTISGVLVYSHSGNTDNIMADIEAQNLPDGIYILSAQTKDNNIPSQKIIIQH